MPCNRLFEFKSNNKISKKQKLGGFSNEIEWPDKRASKEVP